MLSEQYDTYSKASTLDMMLRFVDDAVHQAFMQGVDRVYIHFRMHPNTLLNLAMGNPDRFGRTGRWFWTKYYLIVDDDILVPITLDKSIEVTDLLGGGVASNIYAEVR